MLCMCKFEKPLSEQAHYKQRDISLYIGYIQIPGISMSIDNI